jgi:hypothetical protein
MTSPADAQQYIGRTAVDLEGSKIGKIGQVYLDDRTGEPIWVTVSTGLFGNRQSFAPISGAQFDGDDVRLTVSKDTIKDAPNVDDDEHISASEQDALYQYYGYAGDQGRPGTGTGQAGTGYADQGTEYAGRDDAGYAGQDTGSAGRDRVGTEGHDTSGPTTDEAMTRSEERLNVGKETVQAGRARLRKYVVTENQPRRRPGRPGHHRRRARGHPQRRTARGGKRSRPGRAGPARHRDRHRGRPGQRGRPQGADRRARRRREPAPRPLTHVSRDRPPPRPVLLTGRGASVRPGPGTGAARWPPPDGRPGRWR